MVQIHASLNANTFLASNDGKIIKIQKPMMPKKTRFKSQIFRKISQFGWEIELRTPRNHADVITNVIYKRFVMIFRRFGVFLVARLVKTGAQIQPILQDLNQVINPAEFEIQDPR